MVPNQFGPRISGSPQPVPLDKWNILGTICPGGPNWLGTICPWGPNWLGTVCPGTICVWDQMCHSLYGEYPGNGVRYILFLQPELGCNYDPSGIGKIDVNVGTDVHKTEDLMDTLKKVTSLKSRLTEFDNLKFRGQAFCDQITAVTSGQVETVDLYTTMHTLASQGYRLVSEVNF